MVLSFLRSDDVYSADVDIYSWHYGATINMILFFKINAKVQVQQTINWLMQSWKKY
jgi:hypothetical protein